MIKIIIILSFLLLNLNSFSQGSVNSLDFDGSNDYVSLTPGITNVSAASVGLPTTAITVEAWIKPRSFNNYGGVVSFTQDNATTEHGFLLGTTTANRIEFSIAGGGVGLTYLRTSTTYATNKWYHIVGTYDGTTMSLYVNGILEATSPLQSGAISYLDTRFRIGKYEDDNENYYYNGEIDEVRIWSIAKTQAQIRDEMCKLLTGSEAGLTHYWRFNNGSGTTLTATTGAVTGTLTSMTPVSDWVLSGAPLGNVSSNLYPVSWAGQTVNLASTDKGNIEVNTVAGNPAGIHVYRVDGTPNSTTNITQGLGSNNLYYGTFVVNGTSPTYTIEHTYTNYPDAIDQEPNLILYKRDDNSDPTWLNLSATQNAPANTLTKTVISSRGEFIIASSVGPLPVELLNFNLNLLDNETVKIEWQTVTEINNDYFTVERSKDGTNWEQLKRINGAGHSTRLLNYSIVDSRPFMGTSYYRLKQTDFNGEFEYPEIKSITRKASSISLQIYPNPANNNITITGDKLELSKLIIYNSIGQNVTKLTQQNKISDKQLTIDITELPSGFYYIKTKTTACKVYKQ